MRHSLQSQRTPAEKALGRGTKKKEGEEGVKMWELQIRNRVRRESVYKHMVVNWLLQQVLAPPPTEGTRSAPLVLIPCKALKPCRGTRDEPVTNWSNRARRSSSKNSTAFQNHLTTLLSGVQCFNRVFTFQSLTSIFPSPQIMSC